MGAHCFIVIGAWGSKQTTIAASRCVKCGFIYVAMNFAADPAGSVVTIGENGEDLDLSALADRCPVEG